MPLFAWIAKAAMLSSFSVDAPKECAAWSNRRTRTGSLLHLSEKIGTRDVTRLIAPGSCFPFLKLLKFSVVYDDLRGQLAFQFCY